MVDAAFCAFWIWLLAIFPFATEATMLVTAVPFVEPEGVPVETGDDATAMGCVCFRVVVDGEGVVVLTLKGVA